MCKCEQFSKLHFTEIILDAAEMSIPDSFLAYQPTIGRFLDLLQKIIFAEQDFLYLWLSQDLWLESFPVLLPCRTSGAATRAECSIASRSPFILRFLFFEHQLRNLKQNVTSYILSQAILLLTFLFRGVKNRCFQT